MSRVIRFGAVTAALVLVATFAPAAPVRAVADTLYVADVPAAGAGGSCEEPDFATGADPDNEAIQDALDASQADPAIVEVHICEGEYVLQATLEILEADVTISGDGPEATVISGNELVKIMQVCTGYHARTIRDLSLVDGYNDDEWGGAITFDGELTLDNVHLLRNVAEAGGGAIDNCGDDYDLLVVRDSLVSENVARGSMADAFGGGALLVWGGEVIVERSTFTENQALGLLAADDGGAIYASEVSVTNSLFNLNESAGSGGAIWADISFSSVNSRFEGNEADDGYGGALYLSGLTHVRGTTFTQNSAYDADESGDDGEGGAINQETDCAGFLVERSTFTQNEAQDSGGAINFNDCEPGEIVRVDGSTFTSNEAVYDAGGAIDEDNEAYLQINRNRFSANRVAPTGDYDEGTGGAVWMNHGRLRGNTFSGNTARVCGAAVYVSSHRGDARFAQRNNRFQSNRADGARTRWDVCVGT